MEYMPTIVKDNPIIKTNPHLKNLEVMPIVTTDKATKTQQKVIIPPKKGGKMITGRKCPLCEMETTWEQIDCGHKEEGCNICKVYGDDLMEFGRKVRAKLGKVI